MKTPILIGSYLLLMPFVGIQLKYLTSSYDHITLCFYRFLAASAALLLIVLFFRRSELNKTLRQSKTVALILINSIGFIIASLLYSEGIKHTNTTTACVFGTLMLPFSCIGASLIDRENGIQMLKNPLFIFNWLVITLAAIGFTMNHCQVINMGNYSYGVLILIIKLFFTICIVFLTKKLLNEMDAWVLSCLTVSSASLFLGGILLWRGGLVINAGSDPAIFGLLCFSGIYGVILGVGFSNIITQKFGLINITLINLGMPVFTAAIAFLVLSERLSPSQMIYGAILLCACYCCIICKNSSLTPLRRPVSS